MEDLEDYDHRIWDLLREAMDIVPMNDNGGAATREWSLVKTKLEEAFLWAVAATSGGASLV